MKYMKSFLTWVLLLAATHVMALTVTVDDVQFKPGGTAEIVVNLANTETTLSGYQMSLYLPAGITLQTDDDDDYICILSGRHKSDHQMAITVNQNDGSLLLVCFSLGKKVISGTSGELFRLPVNIASTVTSSVQGSFKNIMFADKTNNSYPAADATINFTLIEKEEQTLSLTALPEMTEGDAAYTLPTQTSQSLALTWSVADATIASISGNMLTPLKAGTTTVTATQAGNDDYLPFTRDFTLTVKEKPVQPSVEVTDISTLDNVIYIEPVEAKTGTQTTISFKMKNSAEIRSFQFDLYLPEGVTVVKSPKGKIQGFLSAGRLPEEDEHRLSFSEHDGGAIRFLCDSEYGDTFTGNDGEIATLLVNISETMADGDYPIIIKDMKLSEVDIANYYWTASISTKLTVSSYTLGDINGDGLVDVSDYSGVASHIHGNTPAGFIAIAGDVDESGNIDVSDYSGIANIIHYGSIHGNVNTQKAPLMVRRANTDLDNYENVIYIKPFTAAAGTQMSISICMKNSVEIRSFQFDLYLPEGITAVKSNKDRIQGFLSAGRLPEEDEHKLTFSEHEGGAIRFLCDSEYGDTFTGNDGEIATLLVNISETMADGDYPIIMKNMKLSEVDIANYYTADYIETTVTIGEVDTRVVLDELATTVPDEATGVDVRVKRTINANEWSTICLPFSMTEEQVTAAFGDGVELGDFTGYTTTKDDYNDIVGITVNFADATAIAANRPYIIKVTTPVTYEDGFTVDGVDIEPDEEPMINFGTSRRPKAFIGTYVANTTVPELCLFLSGNKFWYSLGLTKMKAFRAYFDFYDLLADVDPEYAAPIFISIGDETTRIDTPLYGNEGDDNYYSLDGRLVKTPAKGVYIKNGKKVIVK